MTIFANIILFEISCVILVVNSDRFLEAVKHLWGSGHEN